MVVNRPYFFGGWHCGCLGVLPSTAPEVACVQLPQFCTKNLWIWWIHTTAIFPPPKKNGRAFKKETKSSDSRDNIALVSWWGWWTRLKSHSYLEWQWECHSNQLLLKVGASSKLGHLDFQLQVEKKTFRMTTLRCKNTCPCVYVDLLQCVLIINHLSRPFFISSPSTCVTVLEERNQWSFEGMVELCQRSQGSPTNWGRGFKLGSPTEVFVATSRVISTETSPCMQVVVELLIL